VSGRHLTPGPPPLAPSRYAPARLRRGAAILLRDDRDWPPERLLQAIWQHQRLHRDQLKTLDGQNVRLLHPGFANAEGGPDFRDALVQIGDAAPRSGDVEVDIRSGGWHAHGHDRNPAFRNVILHVVWDGERRAGVAPPSGGSGARDRPAGGGTELRIPPPAALALRDFLDAPLGELSVWLEREPVKSLPENLRGKCSAPLAALAPAQLTELLREAAHTRLQAKAAQFQARARHVGWEQSLWEGLFRALGYKHNVWPMQCLAETRWRWAREKPSLLLLQARLLGLSGLLPAELTRVPAGGAGYLRRVWDGWWRERDEFEDCLLPRRLWRFHGLRPANHPQRRLALAAHWVFADNMAARLERWCAAAIPDRALLDSLREILQVERDDFWSWHWTFRSARFRKPQPLLGATRVTDLAVNVILPWLWTRAGEGRSGKLQREIERRYFAWPPAQDNAVLRLARQRLLRGARRGVLHGAFAQQGLMQIVRDFCHHSNAVCDHCQFPELVREFAARREAR
jgi:hypothetical protein